MREFVTKIGGRVPQRKPHAVMSIPELVKKVEAKATPEKINLKKILKSLKK